MVYKEIKEFEGSKLFKEIYIKSRIETKSIFHHIKRAMLS
jgi:hypothetical protein